MTDPIIRMMRYALCGSYKEVVQNSIFSPELDTKSLLNERHIPFRSSRGSGELHEWWFDGVLIVRGRYAFVCETELQLESNNHWIRLNYDLTGRQKPKTPTGFPPCVPSDLRHLLVNGDDRSPDDIDHLPFSKNFIEVYFTPTYFARIACRDCLILQKIVENMLTQQLLRNGGIVMKQRMQYVLSAILDCKLDGHSRRLFLESKILELFMLQVEQYKRVGCACVRGDSVGPRDLEKLHKARQLLESQINYPFTLKYIAQHSGLNEFKLKKGFKKVFGKTVFQYLTEIRLLKARELLLNDDLTVAEAAERVGFKYAHHFIAVFKKEFGGTPGEFRQAHQKE